MSDTGPGIRFRIGLSGPSLTQTRRADFSVSAEILLRFTFTFTRVTVTLREGLLKNKFVHNAHVTHSYRLKYDCETGAVLDDVGCLQSWDVQSSPVQSSPVQSRKLGAPRRPQPRLGTAGSPQFSPRPQFFKRYR